MGTSRSSHCTGRGINSDVHHKGVVYIFGTCVSQWKQWRIFTEDIYRYFTKIYQSCLMHSWLLQAKVFSAPPVSSKSRSQNIKTGKTMSCIRLLNLISYQEQQDRKTCTSLKKAPDGRGLICHLVSAWLSCNVLASHSDGGSPPPPRGHRLGICIHKQSHMPL